jgi:hypothetical protein
MQAHGILRRIVQRQIQRVEGYDLMEPLRQVVKQRREIAMQRNRLGNLQQRTILLDVGVGIRSDSLILADLLRYEAVA